MEVSHSTFPVYPMMSFDEIATLPVEMIAAENSHLWLWTLATPKVGEFAYKLCRMWGFEPKAEVVWVKIGESGKLHFVPSICVCGCHERCLFATRGRVDAGKAVRSVIMAPRRKYSQKPEEIFQRAECLSHPPRVELFARAKRRGWQSWGNEVSS